MNRAEIITELNELVDEVKKMPHFNYARPGWKHILSIIEKNKEILSDTVPLTAKTEISLLDAIRIYLEMYSDWNNPILERMGDIQDKVEQMMIQDYLLTQGNYSQSRLDAIIAKLKTHSDVYSEFYFFVLSGAFPKTGIIVEGYSAARLVEEQPLLPLGAYNYLIYLREKPQEALENIKKGLPRRRLFH